MIITATNLCPKITIGQLTGEIGWLGVNSRVMSIRVLLPVKPQVAD